VRGVKYCRSAERFHDGDELVDEFGNLPSTRRRRDAVVVFQVPGNRPAEENAELRR